MKKAFDAVRPQLNELFQNKDYLGLIDVLKDVQEDDSDWFLFRGMSLSRLHRQD